MASSNPPPVQRWVRFITGLDNELNPNNELIVEMCTNHEDEDLYQKLISVMRLYKEFNNGNHASLLRVRNPSGFSQFWITTEDHLYILAKFDRETGFSGTYEPITTTVPAWRVPEDPSKIPEFKTVHVRRPRNMFIIYRQWMSGRIRAANPGMTAGKISRVVAQLWRAEKPEVKSHFKALAKTEERNHKLMYPGHELAGARNPRRALVLADQLEDPMTIAETLIAAGH